MSPHRLAAVLRRTVTAPGVAGTFVGRLIVVRPGVAQALVRWVEAGRAGKPDRDHPSDEPLTREQIAALNGSARAKLRRLAAAGRLRLLPDLQELPDPRRCARPANPSPEETAS